jgi:hypothetical protein
MKGTISHSGPENMRIQYMNQPNYKRARMILGLDSPAMSLNLNE